MGTKKIDRDRIEDILSLSPLQKGILFHYLQEPESKVYQVQLCLQLKGDIQPSYVKKAWNYVIENNQALRTVFRWININDPIQIILKSHFVNFREHDLSGLTESEQLKQLSAIRNVEWCERFNLEEVAFRITLCKMKNNEYEMIISNHHILYDGWSNGVILREFFNTYQGIYDEEVCDRPVKNNLKEFIKSIRQQNKVEQQLYWRNYFSGYDSQTNLPYDSLKNKEEKSSTSLSYLFPSELLNDVRKFAKKEKITLATFLYTTWGLLLQKYNYSKESIFGTTVSGRSSRIKNIENMVGLFINTLPLIVREEEGMTARELLHQVNSTIIEREEYEQSSLIDIKSYSNHSHQDSLFNSIVVIENYPLDNIFNQNYAIQIETFSIHDETNFDLVLAITPELGEYSFRFNNSLFKKKTIELISGNFKQLIREIIMNPELKLNELNLITKEQKLFFEKINNTDTLYPRNHTLNELFEEQVQKYPDQVALVFGERNMTYRELDRKANGLAHRLQAKGVKADTLVGLLGEHSLETLVSMVAILKAGGAYLPIDPNYPLERKQYMMQDSGLDLVVATENYDWDETILGGEVIQLSSINELEGREDSPIVLSHPKDLAYVLYTSGSTGQPKGVMVEQRNVVRLIKNTNFTDLSQGRLLLTGAIVFDASTFEIWGALLNGLTLSLIEKDTLLNPFKLQKIIERQKITTMWLTAPLFNQISQQHLEVFENLTSLIVGGDVLSPYHINAVRERYPNLKLINGYGPTENTTFSTTFLIEDTYEASIPIGRPIANSTAYVLNPYQQLCPVGIPGELYVGGAGVARGYLNKPELTTEKFIDNPFVPGERLYRTGDMVRWLADGNIEYIGRIDKQIKIRGHRIEPGEIVSHLLNHEAIQEAAVVPLQDSQGDAYLCAYYVPVEGVEEEEYTESSLRAYLSTRLPDYMMPSAFCQLEKLPLTVNGKLDAAALPELDRSMYTTKEYVPPQNEAERKLSVIWQEVLGVEEVGRFNHFFESGGHSLKAMLLVSRIVREFEVTFQVKDVFHSPVLYQMAETIEQMNPEVYLRIEPVESRDFYPVSSAQQRIHVVSQLATESVHYNVPLAFEIEGDLQKERLVKAFEVLIERHEALRTSFHMKEDTLVQCIHKQVDFSLEEIEGTEESIPKLLQQFVRPFDLTKPLLMRAGLLEVDTKKRLLLVDLHHIITDGMSTNILLQELVQLCQKPTDLEPLRIQYKDYAVWQQEFLQTEGMKRQEAFWLEQLEGELPILELPIDFPRPSVQQFEGAYVDVRVNRETTEKLHVLTKEENGTLYMTLLAAYNVLLARYTGQEDFIVGTPIAGRPHADLEPIVGMFVNTLAIRNKLVKDKPFRQFLQEVRENVLKSYEHQMYPLEDLIEKLKVQRDMSRNPLFDTIFTLQNVDLTVPKGEGFLLCPYPFDYQMSKVDVTVGAVEEEGELHLRFEYSTALFTRETIEQMSMHFCTILQEIANHPDVVIANIDVTTEEEKERLLVQYNKTETAYPRNKSLAELFEEQVQEKPDGVALVFKNQKMTYRTLNERANQLARTLREQGVASGEVVGIMANRSFEMVIGVLAVLKAGAAYLPIDPNYPVARKQYMLEDSGANFLLIQKELDEEMVFEGTVLDLEDETLYGQGTVNESIGNYSNSEDIASIIYTSGSTGQPKGNMTTHYNISRIVKDTNYISISEQDRLLQMASFSFDASFFEIFGSLLNGAQLVLIEKEDVLDAQRLFHIIETEGITVSFVTTALFNMLVDMDLGVMKGLRKILFGGEKVSVSHVREALRAVGSNRLIHVYGPTESTVFTTFYPVNELEEDVITVPIGVPISNTKVYVLNHKHRLCPIGVPGELYIGGDGLAKGYLNRAELTAEKFIESPVVPGEKLYRTGDMVRWLLDGNIDYIGRIDKQIKIRGHRIEPGEIVSHLLNHEAVREAAVVPLQDSQGDAYLCAYYVPVEGIEEEEYTESSLRAYLSTRLPDYMMPSAFCQLGKLPLTVNGKLDTAALPEPDRNMYITKEYVPPQNETERKLSVIWQEVLGIEEVGRFDHFFESGGHSLKAMLLVSRIVREFEVTFQVKDVFHSPVLYQMAETIEQMNPEVYLRIEPVESRDFYPVSSAQQRIHVASQLATESVHYNVPLVFEIEGDLQKERLVKAFEMLIKRHEALRTSFHMKENTLVQCIHNQVEFSLEEIEGIEENVPKLLQEFVRPFDLTKPLLMRAGLLEVDTKKRLLLVDLHHIITDGMSTNILLQELVQLYQKPSDLEPLRIQYKDYAVWQQKFLQTEGMKRQEAFWLEKLEGELPILELPTDFPRPSVQQFEGAYVDVRVNRETTEKLQALTKEENGTLYMTLLAAYNVLLARYTGQEDFIVGTPIAGRPHEDLEPIIGMFVNTLAIRNKLVNDKPFREFLQEVRENVLKSYEHQMYPLEDLIGKLKVQRDMSRNPLFDTIFTLQNVDLTVPQGEGFMLCPYPFDYQMSKVDVTVGAVEEEGELHLRFEYSTALFTRETIEQMSTHFCTILQKIANHPDVVIANIDVTTEEEKERLIVQYNKTETAYPKNKSLAELFEEQVQKYPDQVALVYGEQSMTYRELDRKANGLAHRLQAKGVKADTLVGLLGEHSLETLVSMVAILKAGGAYLPIDPNYPLERKQYMMQDSGLDLVVATENYDWDETILGGEVIQLSSINELEGREDSPIVLSHPKDLAYVLYTSGSTGQPKGVMVEQRNVVRLIKNTNFTDLSQGRLLLTGAIVFDASTFEIWGALLNGLTLSLIEKDTLLNPFKLQKIIERQKITTMWLTAPLFNQISQQHLEVFENLTSLIVGGDVLSPYHINAVRERYPNLKLINGYGPTENTTFSTTFLIEDTYEASIPIGRPIANSTAYVLNPYQQLCPVGIPGELYVGGAGVARGYLNKPELTTEKFIDNPFVPGERLYRTGDMVRWLVDGNIEYIGRIDKQIKIRGHRIEPGEIVSHFLNHEAIQEAAVVPLQDSQGDAYLCAYYVLVEGMEEEEYTESSLRAYFSTRLPDYMMPSAFCQLEKLPLTVNGKIDNQLLPVPEKIDSDTMYRAPEDELEEKLVEIWKGILGVSHIGTLDNFFASGGHSLKAMQLIGRIQKEFQIDCALRDVFQQPTIREFATFVRGNQYQTYIKIEKTEEAPCYPVTFAQQRLYVVNQLENVNTAYNMPLMLKVDSGLDYKRLSRVFQILIERHEAFRTMFGMEGDELVQYIHPSVSYKIKQSEVKYEDIERIQKEFVRPFDLSRAPLLRTEVLNLPDNTSIIMIDMHHIISDGVSMDLFLKEFVQLYENEEIILPVNQIQYKDYAVWQKQQANIEKMAEHEAYWLDVFSGELPNLELPTDNVRPPVQQFVGNYISTEIPANLVSQIKKNNSMYESTLFMTLMAAYNVLLWKYTGQTDLIVGTTDVGRPQVEMDTVIGMFVNTLALRTKLSPNQTFEELVANVKESVLQVNEHRAYPFEKLVEKVVVQRDISRNPLFDTMFTLRNRADVKSSNKQANLHIVDAERNVAKFDLTLGITEGENGLTLDWEYSTNLFTEATIQRMTSHYVQVLTQMIENPRRKLLEFDLFTPLEKQQLLAEYNDTAVSYCDNVTIHQLFEEQVSKTPKAIALVHRDKQVTFEELNQRANKLARVLRAKGVGPEVIVGIMIKSSIDMVVSILAVLKAGGAYLPIDSDYPLERKVYMLEDSRATHLLTQFDWKEEAFSGEVLNVTDPTLYQEDGGNLIPLQGSEHAAYVIYTSGSTGKPKGVVIEHKGVINYIDWAKKKYVCGADDTFALYSSLSFDLTVTSLFTPLLSGLCTYVYEDDHNEFILYRILRENKVTILKLTPAHLSLLQEGDYKNTRVRKLIVGGEELKRKLAECILERFPKGVDIINEYGPTEATVGCMNYHFNKNQKHGSSVPIGKPIQNTQIYVLDEHYNPVLTGCVGEIYIAGDGLARGYLGREELTKERFILNPFREEQRMYKTGDLARMRADGQLEYIGRVDRQVKIHGYRIELGEIEEPLQMHEAVKEVVVIDRVDEEKQVHLCAYMVTTQQWNQTDMRQYLMKSLPSYMIPTFYMDVPSIPLTLNGKVDYTQLPEPERANRMVSNFKKPRNEVEEKLLNIWIEVLGVEQIGIQDNFFELGGDSIKAIKIASRLQQEGYKLEIQQLMRYGTIEEVSLYVESTSIEINQEAIEGKVPLTPIQQWFYENELTDRHHYNQAMMLYRPEGFDQILLQQVLNKIMEHHDALRMVYQLKETRVSQINQGLEMVKAHLEIRDLRGRQKVAEEIETQANEIQRSFNLETGPLIATVLFQTDDGDHLLLVAHHLVIDGVSWRILLEDLSMGYQQRLRGEEIQFPPKTHSYQEWANKLVDYANSKKILRELEYWNGIENVKTCSLPVNKEKDEEIACVSITFSSLETERLLKSVHQAYRTNINDILLTALGMTLQEWTNKSRFLVHLEGHGREDIGEAIDVSRTVGWFTSIYPIILETNSLKHIGNEIKRTKEMLRKVPNKGIGYGVIKYLMKDDSKTDHSQLPILFNYLGQFDQDINNIVFQPSTMSTGKAISPTLIRKYVLEIMGIVTEKQLTVRFDFNSGLLHTITVENLAEIYSQNILRVIEHCMQKEGTEITPSDVGYVGLSINDLETIQNKLNLKLKL